MQTNQEDKSTRFTSLEIGLGITSMIIGGALALGITMPEVIDAVQNGVALRVLDASQHQLAVGLMALSQGLIGFCYGRRMQNSQKKIITI